MRPTRLRPRCATNSCPAALRVKSAEDGERLVAFRRVGDYPLCVSAYTGAIIVNVAPTLHGVIAAF